MNGDCHSLLSSAAADKFRAWRAEGERQRLTLLREDFPEGQFQYGLLRLLASGSWSERLRQRWRSLCSWMGCHTPLNGWKTFWYRKAGVNIGENVHLAPGVILDLLFPQLITLEDGVVLGPGAIIVSHVYTPERIVIDRAIAGKRSMVDGQGILAIATMGEASVLAAYSYTVKPIPAGHIGVGVPAVVQPRSAAPLKEDNHDQCT
ncbi:MAG: hypothetical protein LBF51_10720 [Zoogloeaceae bacterium]|jgi:maltose O-acetyltransferase|nr:hypothetical protein [Zoogloeaceae bacterium]